MAMRRTPTTRRRAVANRRSRSRKISRPWSREEIAFMRKFYRSYETAWVARQLGRTVYSVRYKAVDLHIRKASPSIWKGNVGSPNAFRKSPGWTNKTWSRKTATRRRTTRTPFYRASSKRRTGRQPKSRRVIRQRTW